MSSHDNSQELKLDRTKLKAVILDMIAAAFDTSSTTIEWALSELQRHPQVKSKLQKELEEVVGMDKIVEETDLGKLTFLDLVVKETFRLHPAVPLLLPHESTEDITVNGYDIPKKSRILVNAWAIGRDPVAWSENAEEFFPERFTGRDIDVRGHDFQLIPFGSGRRGCPGMQLGILTVKYVLAQLVHCFDMELADGMLPSGLDMTEKFGLTLPRANPLLGQMSCLCPSPKIGPNITNAKSESSSTIYMEKNGLYVVGLKVGSRGQILCLLLDTGSNIVWWQCQTCRRCFDLDHPIIDPKLSSSFRWYHDHDKAESAMARDEVTTMNDEKFERDLIFGCARQAVEVQIIFGKIPTFGDRTVVEAEMILEGNGLHYYVKFSGIKIGLAETISMGLEQWWYRVDRSIIDTVFTYGDKDQVLGLEPLQTMIEAPSVLNSNVYCLAYTGHGVPDSIIGTWQLHRIRTEKRMVVKEYKGVEKGQKPPLHPDVVMNCRQTCCTSSSDMLCYCSTGSSRYLPSICFVGDHQHKTSGQEDCYDQNEDGEEAHECSKMVFDSVTAENGIFDNGDCERKGFELYKGIGMQIVQAEAAAVVGKIHVRKEASPRSMGRVSP
ncbi:hypothetical protein SLEP1_g47173 [Rubroshorea leprosula]|uniref:Xylanase inhibitor N-terminal domain-containing protein n=1 Tax=Rubroshorea leprosula TaxID=152421 RepID=A0AAV5LPT2_9ROSI|nr:hypothetical protein SLEP1_g47173 [Rubroshorea leprosula]